MCARPNPTRSSLNIVSGSPRIPLLVPHPRTRNPNVVGTKRICIRCLVNWFRRLGQITNLYSLDWLPEPRHPLISIAGFSPIAWYPIHAWGQDAPKAAHPDEIAIFI